MITANVGETVPIYVVQVKDSRDWKHKDYVARGQTPYNNIHMSP